MTAASTTFDDVRPSLAESARAFVARNGWGLGLIGFLALLLIFTRMIQPTYGIAGIQGLAISILPLAFAASAQAVVVIAGGIDLSLGSIMALTSVVAAVAMKGQSEEVGVVVAIGVLLLGILIGAINGALVVLTRVPDIVVTLAMAFVWAGAALLILGRPGGQASHWLTDIVKGGAIGGVPFVEWVPKAAIVLIIVIALVWIPIQRSRFGLALYAVGSNQLAAFRSGVSIGRTKIFAYGLMGLFAAFGGLSLIASTAIASPVPGTYTLLSVAAIVLGGVSLAGGRGGLFGPIIAVIILQLISTDMTFLEINSNLATVAQGAILVGVVMFGTLLQAFRSRR